GDLRLLGGGQQVQDRVGGAAHRDVERHGVLEGRGGGDAAGQDRVVVLLVVAAGEVQDRPGRADVQVLAGGVGGEDRAVARQGQADGLGQAVHRVGGEHARTGAAGGAGVLLDAEDVRVGDLVVDRFRHRVDQVERADRAVDERGPAGLHRAAGDEDRGDVQAQGRVEHARGDLVAVGDADQGVGAVGLDHVLDAVRDQVPGGQGVQHAAVAHRDAVVDGDGVELARDAARRDDRLADDPADRGEVGVAGDELREAVGDGDDRLAADVRARYTGGPHEGAGARHVAAVGDCAGPQLGHRRSLHQDLLGCRGVPESENADFRRAYAGHPG